MLAKDFSLFVFLGPYTRTKSSSSSLSRVAGDIATKEVTVPADYLDSLPDNTLVKIEVGAIGAEDNATFTEIFDICVNEILRPRVTGYEFLAIILGIIMPDEDEGCDEEEDDDDG